MPHAIDAEAGLVLLPAEVECMHRNNFASGGEEFRFALTAEGQRHPVTQQSIGDSVNERVWSGFPALSWRHPVTGMKKGAEVLLSAATADAP